MDAFQCGLATSLALGSPFSLSFAHKSPQTFSLLEERQEENLLAPWFPQGFLRTKETIFETENKPSAEKKPKAAVSPCLQ